MCKSWRLFQGFRLLLACLAMMIVAAGGAADGTMMRPRRRPKSCRRCCCCCCLSLAKAVWVVVALVALDRDPASGFGQSLPRSWKPQWIRPGDTVLSRQHVLSCRWFVRTGETVQRRRSSAQLVLVGSGGYWRPIGRADGWAKTPAVSLRGGWRVTLSSRRHFRPCRFARALPWQRASCRRPRPSIPCPSEGATTRRIRTPCGCGRGPTIAGASTWGSWNGPWATREANTATAVSSFVRLVVPGDSRCAPRFDRRGHLKLQWHRRCFFANPRRWRPWRVSRKASSIRSSLFLLRDSWRSFDFAFGFEMDG